MGEGYCFSCKNCGYTFEANLGIGFMFPSVYEEVMNKARGGKLGPDAQRFLSEHPDGALDCSTVALNCKKCGELGTDLSCDMYIPKQAQQIESEDWKCSPAFPVEGAKYVMPMDLIRDYDLVQRYPHRCAKCNGEMESISKGKLTRYGYEDVIDKRKLKCPHCRQPLVMSDALMWD